MCFAVLTLLFLMIQAEESFAQFNRGSIKNENKRISIYRGAKSKFGKGKVYNSIGFSINAFNYYGDLSPSPSKISTDISFTKPGFAVSYTHRFGPRYSLQAQFMFGTISGSDAESASKRDSEIGRAHV